MLLPGDAAWMVRTSRRNVSSRLLYACALERDGGVAVAVQVQRA